MPDLGKSQGIDIEMPKPVEVPQSPVLPEIVPPHEQPIPLMDPAPPAVEVRA